MHARWMLALVAVAALATFGCTSDYDNDDAADTGADYNDTGTGTGTGTTTTPDTYGTDPNVTGTAVLDDDALQDQIQRQLDADPRFEDVDVEVDEGVATIEGEVKAQADLDHVQQMIRQMQGVKDVKLDVQIQSDKNLNGM